MRRSTWISRVVSTITVRKLFLQYADLGLEIGRAQAVQAEAASIACSSDMNPVLLKPNGNAHAQLILHGKSAGNQSAMDYFMGKDKAALWEEVKMAYDRLADHLRQHLDISFMYKGLSRV